MPTALAKVNAGSLEQVALVLTGYSIVQYLLWSYRMSPQVLSNIRATDVLLQYSFLACM